MSGKKRKKTNKKNEMFTLWKLGTWYTNGVSDGACPLQKQVSEIQGARQLCKRDGSILFGGLK